MNTDFLEQCYGTQVFCALEMLSVIVTSATPKFSSLHLGFIFLVSKKKGTGDVTYATRPALVRLWGIKHGSLNSTCLLYVTY